MNSISWNSLYYDISSKCKMFQVDKILPACSLLHSIYEQFRYNYLLHPLLLNSYLDTFKSNPSLLTLEFLLGHYNK